MTTRADRSDVPTRLVRGFNFDGFYDVLPWGPDGINPTSDYCPCCGVELGDGDATLEGARAKRRAWREGGMIWSQPRGRWLGLRCLAPQWRTQRAAGKLSAGPDGRPLVPR